MRIEIKSIAEKGNVEKERLVLKVKTDTDIGDYILIQAGFDDGEVMIDTYQAYWFPYKAVSEGDLIVLYTRSGKQNTRELDQGGTVHFYYWGLSEAIWDTSERTPVLLYAPEWINKSPDEL